MLLLTVSLAVLLIAVVLAWNYRQWEYLPSHGPYTSDLDERSRILQDRVEILTKRVGDMELLVLLLLGASGLYSIVFVASSYLGAVSFGRQADRTIANFRDQLGVAMGELRELKEDTERRLSDEPKRGAGGDLEDHVAAIGARIASLQPDRLDEQARLELLHYESAVAYLELTGGAEIGASISRLYRILASFYDSRDKARFYLNRAALLSPSGSELTSEIRYDLACWYAANNDFAHSTSELTLAFQRPSKALDDRIARDIEEGGKLYNLANTPPFDKVVNDLLLNITLVP
ncbi:MAG TPA: hypothetical protein VIX89_14625 [Bryobacteraceae bacterium]